MYPGHISLERLPTRFAAAVHAKLADLTLHIHIGYWVNLTREYRERATKIAYEDTMRRRAEVEKVLAG